MRRRTESLNKIVHILCQEYWIPFTIFQIDLVIHFFGNWFFEEANFEGCWSTSTLNWRKRLEDCLIWTRGLAEIKFYQEHIHFDETVHSSGSRKSIKARKTGTGQLRWDRHSHCLEFPSVLSGSLLIGQVCDQEEKGRVL